VGGKIPVLIEGRAPRQPANRVTNYYLIKWQDLPAHAGFSKTVFDADLILRDACPKRLTLQRPRREQVLRTNLGIDMNKTIAILTAGAFALITASALADDKTLDGGTPAEQAKMKQEAAAKKAAMAKMTPEQRAAAKKARSAETLKYEATMEKVTQDPKDARNMAINKSAAESKAGPTPRHGTMNTPQADKFLSEQKGQ
jgi:hypothetical protein